MGKRKKELAIGSGGRVELMERRQKREGREEKERNRER